jgi:hypothetical protein
MLFAPTHALYAALLFEALSSPYRAFSKILHLRVTEHELTHFRLAMSPAP